MAAVAVVARKPTSLSASGVTVTMDAVVRETHNLESEVTTHPVEKGADITDHVRSKPERVTLTDCVVSNTPLSHQQQSRIVRALSGGLSFTSSSDPPREGPGYAETAFQNLLKLRDAKDLLTVVTTLRTYDAMVIESISIDREAKSSDALKFTMALRRVVIVENKQTRVVKAKDKRVGKKVSDGKKVTKPPEKEKSLAAAAADSAAGASNSTVSGFGKFVGGVP